jgi:hypothetical protein
MELQDVLRECSAASVDNGQPKLNHEPIAGSNRGERPQHTTSRPLGSRFLDMRRLPPVEIETDPAPTSSSASTITTLFRGWYSGMSAFRTAGVCAELLALARTSQKREL